jgi:NTP pyrophosphatase (non-canonical NTP hydrolase)
MIRAMRLLEEATELAQAEGVGELEATLIVKKVYSKPIGDPVKEFGGVMITAAIYAHCRGLDMEESFMKEYERIMNVKIMNRVRQRNLSGDKPGLD